MLPHRALSGGRRNGLGARATFTTDCYVATTSRLRVDSAIARRKVELFATMEVVIPHKRLQDYPLF